MIKAILESYLVQSQLVFLFLSIFAIALGKTGVISPLIGFYTTVLCSFLLVVVFGVSGVKLLLVVSQPESSKVGLMTAMIVGLVPFIVMVAVMSKADFSQPMIHDITTDLNNPPQFVAAFNERKSGENSLAYNKGIIEDQLHAYPGVKPLMSEKSREELFSKALSLIESRGWQLLNVDESQGIIEAVDETKIFGFKDDVVIRAVTVDEGHIRIDMRSVSRVGKGDLGANAKRIIHFMDDLRMALSS